MSFTTLFSHLVLPHRNFVPLWSIYSPFMPVLVNWQLLEEIFCALTWNKSNTMKHPCSDQLPATGHRFIALALFISPHHKKKLCSTNHSGWQQKILFHKCFGRTSVYDFPSFFTPWMHTWPWPGMQMLQLHTVILSTVGLLFNTSAFLKMIKMLKLVISWKSSLF